MTKDNLTYDDIYSRLITLGNDRRDNCDSKAYYENHDGKKDNRSTLDYCTWCKSRKEKRYQGHNHTNCQKMAAYRNKKKQKKQSAQTANQVTVTEATAFMVDQTTVSNSDSWIFDSGCSSHCTGDRTQFTNLRPHSGTLTIADGTKLAITRKDTVQLNCRLSSGNVTPATLYNVLLVLHLGMNRLFSWTTVSRKGFKMTGLAEDIKLMDKNGKEVLWAKRDGSNQNVIQVVNNTANICFLLQLA